ncbi:MAG: GNAT family N-acetyltransferase [Oscillospiraceae bacterium]|nr:GNAT family N-acetyltransferase [Oscillospiraceae bacterium]
MEKVFESERINFVRMTEELLYDYLEMVNDLERVARFIRRNAERYTISEEREFIQSIVEDKPPFFSMIERGSGEFIGNIELRNLKDNAAELGIAITAKKQDQGFGTESVSRIISYGFDTLGLNKVSLRVYRDNPRAICVYQKCGFTVSCLTEDDILMEIVKRPQILRTENTVIPKAALVLPRQAAL